MSNRIPDYLKLHVEEPKTPHDQEFPEFDRLRLAFPNATGCQLAVESRPGLGNQLTFPWLETPPTQFQVSLETANVAGFPNPKAQDIRELSEAITDLLNELSRTRHALRRREAELATGVPVVSVAEDGKHLADRLESVLREAAGMLQCDGAGLYLLDETTTCLKLRAHFGLNHDALTRPARRLEDAMADIEAMAGHAVVIDNASGHSHWNVPEAAGSAICVPVSSPTTILGTLWFYGEFDRDFAPAEQNLAELTAGRLASDLDRNVLMQEVRRLRQSPSDLVEREAGRIAPTRITPLVEGWDVAETSGNASTKGDFCFWHVAADDQLHLAVAAPHGVNRPLSSRVLQAALTAHTQHNPTVADLFAEMNQTLWSLSEDGNPTSLFHATLDPSCGALNYGLIGRVDAYVLRPHGWEPLLGERGPLGEDGEFRVQTRKQALMPGDILVVMSNPEPTPAHRAETLMNQVAEKLLRNTHLAAAELAELAGSVLREKTTKNDLAILVAKRDET